MPNTTPNTMPDCETELGAPTRGSRWKRISGTTWYPKSLRSRVTLVASVVVAIALVLGAFAMASLLTGSRIAALDDEAVARASTIADLAEGDRLPAVLPVGQPGEIAQVLDVEGRVIATSATGSLTLPVVSGESFADLTRHEGEPSTVTDSPYGDSSVRAVAYSSRWHDQDVWSVATVPMRDVEGTLATLRLALLVVVPLLVAIVAVVCWAALGRALAPVEKLRRDAETLKSAGGSGTLAVPETSRELARLALTLNELLDQLARAGQRQASFTADAAHELRTPLATLRATTEVAQLHPESYDAQELAAEVHGEVVRLQAIVEDLLVLARAGTMPLQREGVDLRELVDAVVSRIPVRDHVSVSVVGHGVARADARACERIVRNLVENAIRHAASRVIVEVSDDGFEVRDDGSGIPDAERGRVFERFARLQDGRDRDSGGSGLGLPIARELARSMSGDVKVVDPGTETGPADGSRRSLAGATLRVNLPRAT